MNSIKLKATILILLFVNFCLLFHYNLINIVENNDQEAISDAKKMTQFSWQNEKDVVNQHDYSYMLNPEFGICGEDGGKGVTLLAMVPISASSFTHRFIIRNSWGSKNIYPDAFRLVFLIGNTNNETLNSLIKDEYSIFGDIVQEDFADTYRNLTIKTMMGMKWVASFCPNSKFILKIDDDVCLNSYKLINYLNYTAAKFPNLKNTMICRPHIDTLVERDPESKFYVPVAEYPREKWHTYCDGGAYMFTNDLAEKFFLKSLHIKNFVFEDIHIGSFAEALNTSFMDIGDRYDIETFVFEEGRAFKATPEELDDLFFIHVMDRFDLITLWRHLVQTFAFHMFNSF